MSYEVRSVEPDGFNGAALVRRGKSKPTSRTDVDKGFNGAALG